jgi:hypothetical protein
MRKLSLPCHDALEKEKIARANSLNIYPTNVIYSMFPNTKERNPRPAPNKKSLPEGFSVSPADRTEGQKGVPVLPAGRTEIREKVPVLSRDKTEIREKVPILSRDKTAIREKISILSRGRMAIREKISILSRGKMVIREKISVLSRGKMVIREKISVLSRDKTVTRALFTLLPVAGKPLCIRVSERSPKGFYIFLGFSFFRYERTRIFGYYL